MRLIDADALIERIDKSQAEGFINKNSQTHILVALSQVFEIIKKQPTIEPEPRWIPCSKRLPEEHESIWAKAKGTDLWSEAMWEKQSDEVIVTVLFEDGTTRTDTAYTHDGEWYEKAKIVKRKIIAWMPPPEPYKGE